MSADFSPNPNVIRRNERIREDFNKMNSLNKYKKEYIFEGLGLKYFLLPRTIERIIWGEYERRYERSAEKAAKALPARKPVCVCAQCGYENKVPRPSAEKRPATRRTVSN